MGELVWEAVYNIYGGFKSLNGSRILIPFRQAGQYEDVETSLYYNRFRYYNPETGSYLSKDPIGLLGNNPNMYAYVFDSNREVDILGLDGEAIMQPYRDDVLTKNPHADVHVNGRKVTEARLGEDGKWFRWGDLSKNPKDLKAADKVIAGMSNDPKIKSEALSQIKQGVEEAEQIMKHSKPNSGGYKRAERSATRLKETHEKVTGKPYK